MSQPKRRYENVLIEELVPYENNARTHSNEQILKIRESIREFGFINPILIDGKKNVIAGHGRIEAAKQEGLTELPCLFVEDLTEAQKRAYIIADNRLAMDAGWDNEKLRIELEALEDMNFNLDVIGFDEDELEGIMNFTEMEDITEDDFQFTEDEKPAKAKRGQVYQLGKHRLMCGDSTSREDVLTLMNGKIADMVVTDPPYNVNYGRKMDIMHMNGLGSEGKYIANDFMPEEEFVAFLSDAFSNMQEVLKPGGVFYIWHASTRIYEFETALRVNNMRTRQTIIWNKSGLVLGQSDYHWKHEPCLYGWREGAAHYFIDDRKQTTVIEDKGIDYKKLKKEELVQLLNDIFSDKISTTIMNEAKPARSDEHPTMKPLGLIARQIKNSSKQGEIVLDIFGGSGSTLMSSEQTNRTCYMMELDPKYIDSIIDRWEKFTGEKAELIHEALQ